ncbi:uncharacterized protein N7515_000129 [Penicillium bovifimosum]|uniref:Uncharacterized protein n=1 Tax=Penicillium bovifimosum TaxID=126998 RepID=A0A9W9HET7_9EURO|nr:uncharacterized protein N7515_000129 [Penicillium bovifimosum]KAJ5145565.1 hypothetical protein N7515_000129 [Penicillium bovifimosum]
MPRIQSHDYNHPSYHPQNTFASPSLRSGFSPATQSVSVVVRNPRPTNNTPGSETRANITGGSSRGILGTDLYYAPMAVSMSQDGGEGSVLMSSPSTGTKRPNDDDLDDSSRQHRRLTTREEVALFEICNRNADTFGSRSNLCKWWASIAAEFTRTHEGRTYSWHSVRRKVEMVTRQRIKFLEEQQQRGTDGYQTATELMNPGWLAAVDAWIPTWQRWEEAENRRIAKRDELKKRRQPQPWRKNGKKEDWRDVSSVTSPTGVNTAMAGMLQQGLNNGDTAATTSPTPSPTITGPTPVQFSEQPSTPVSAPSLKLPPGFENMFATQLPHVPPLPSASTSAPPDGRMVSAVIETLGKLNKHLDSAPGEGVTSPVISALVQASTSTQVSPRKQQQPQQQDQNLTQQIEKMKKELRQEMQDQFRQELEKERVSMEEKLDALQRTQDLILEMLRQEPA